MELFNAGMGACSVFSGKSKPCKARGGCLFKHESFLGILWYVYCTNPVWRYALSNGAGLLLKQDHFFFNEMAGGHCSEVQLAQK